MLFLSSLGSDKSSTKRSAEELSEEERPLVCLMKNIGNMMEQVFDISDKIEKEGYIRTSVIFVNLNRIQIYSIVVEILMIYIYIYIYIYINLLNIYSNIIDV